MVVRRGGADQTISFTLGRKDLRYLDDPLGRVLVANVPIWALGIALAWLIAWRRPSDATARLAALMQAAGTPLLNQGFLLLLAPGLAGVIARLPAPLAALPLAVLVGTPVVALVATTMFLAKFPRPLLHRRRAWAPLWLYAALFTWMSWVLVYNWVYWPTPPYVSPNWFRTAVAPVVMLLLPALVLSWPVLLAWNYRRLESPSDRRRTRVLVAGMALSFLVAGFHLFLVSARVLGSGAAGSWQSRLVAAYWLSPLRLLSLLLQAAGPLALAYAVLRHRVLDVGVLLRQGLQYAVAKRALLALAPLLGLALVADLVLHSDQTLAQAFLSRGWLYAALAGAALLAHAKSRAWLPALDRAFFRERYDAQRILRAVLADVRQTADLRAAGARAVSQIEEALHPEFAAILVRLPHEPAFRVSASSGDLPAPPEIRADGKLMTLVRVLGKPVEISPSDTGWLRRQLPAEETDGLARARVEWIFPIALGADRAEGLLVLGPKRSEEPYTQEDQDLLEAIASGLAVVAERTTAALSARDGSAGGGGSLPTVETAAFAFGRRYVVRRELGRGGMGTVYEARDTELERAVAIKVMRPDLLALGRGRRALQARGARRRRLRPPQRRHDLRLQRGRGRARVPGDGAARRLLAPRGAAPRRPLPASARSARSCAESAPRSRPPTSAACSTATSSPRTSSSSVRRRRDAQGARLRGRKGARRRRRDDEPGRDRNRPARRHARLHVARAAPGASARAGLGRVGPDGDHLRDADRRPPVCRERARRSTPPSSPVGSVPPSQHLGDDGRRWDALFARALGPEPGRAPRRRPRASR